MRNGPVLFDNHRMQTKVFPSRISINSAIRDRDWAYASAFSWYGKSDFRLWKTRDIDVIPRHRQMSRHRRRHRRRLKQRSFSVPSSLTPFSLPPFSFPAEPPSFS